MSSRALRRQQQTDLFDDSDKEEDSVIVEKPSAFSLLLVDDHDDESDGEEMSPQEVKDEKSATPKKNKKKNKRKNDKKNKAKPENKDEFDELLEEFQSAKMVDEPPQAHQAEETSWLHIDEAHLDAEREMRRRFGSVGEESEEQSVKINLPRNQRKPRKLRRQLIDPRPRWPPVAASAVGLELERSGEAWQLVESPEHVVWSEELREIVELGDISLLAQHVRLHPFHIDALLIYSDYLRMHSVGDAAEMVELAMLCLERVLLKEGLYLWSPSLQLPYPAGSNRTLHLALLRHLQYLTRRGCYRTALELSKLALRLDSSDPVGVAYLLDFLAFKAGEEDPSLWNWFLESPRGPVTWECTRALLRHKQGVQNPAVSAAAASLIRQGEPATPFLAATAKLYAARHGPLWKGIHFPVKEEPVEDKGDHIDSTAEASLYRHIILTDLPNLTVPIPQHLNWLSVHALDPIPPEIFTEEPSQRPHCRLS